jgi:hypothetical protein
MFPRPELPRSVHNAEGGVVLDLNHGRMFSLNASGSAIFQLLEQGISEDRIVEELVRRFAIPADTARADLTDFRKSLERLSLLACDGNSSAE